MKLAIERGEIASGLMKEWRSDRAYLDSFRSDFRDVSDLLAQLQVYLDPRAIEAVRHPVSGPADLEIDAIPEAASRSCSFYADALKAKGYDSYAVDIASPDVASTGLSVTRAFVPGLIANFPAAFPTLGKNALQKAAVQLGLCDRIVPDSDLNYMPLPHA